MRFARLCLFHYNVPPLTLAPFNLRNDQRRFKGDPQTIRCDSAFARCVVANARLFGIPLDRQLLVTVQKNEMPVKIAGVGRFVAHVMSNQRASNDTVGSDIVASLTFRTHAAVCDPHISNT
jgi:hypothetical protein